MKDCHLGKVLTRKTSVRMEQSKASVIHHIIVVINLISVTNYLYPQNDIIAMNEIERFVDKYKDRSINTVKNYRKILKNYFNTIDKEPTAKYFKQTEDEFKKDIEIFWKTIKKHAPKTRNQMIYCIKSFLMRNGVELKTMFYRDLLDSIKEKGTITQDNVLTTEDIQKVLAHGNEKDRALILTLCTSGMRIGELLKIEEDSLHLDHDPPYIYLSGKITKNGYPRFTFITNEAKKAVIEWQQVKKSYIKRVQHKNNLPDVINRDKDENDPKLFPFSYSPVAQRWRYFMKIIGKDEVDPRTNRMKLHIHSLRAWCNTKLGNTMPDMKRNYIIGHTTYLSKEYDKFKEADIKDDYKKAMMDLMISESPVNLSGINESLKEKDEEIAKMRADIEKMHNEILTLQNLETLAKLLKKT
jgi:integrase